MEDKSIFVTGGTGFLGKHILENLQKTHSRVQVYSPARSQCDLMDAESVSQFFRKVKPGYLIHLATPTGGVSLLKERPHDAFYQNTSMAMNVLRASAENNVKKVIFAGSALSYPANATLPYKEIDFWSGYPEELEAPYGMAHKAAIAYSKALARVKNLKMTYLVLSNLYGPKDHFDENSHVIPAMIKRFEEAKRTNKPQVELWGTGIAKREFLYVEDAARGLISLLDKDSPEVLNFGSGEEVSMKNLAESVANLIGYKGKLVWDATKPEGRLRRCLDSTIAHREFNLSAQTKFENGLSKTINWYLNK